MAGLREARPSLEERNPLAARAARSSVHSVVGQVAQFGIGIASVVLLTPWVAPADYGVLAMASVITGLLGAIGDSGVGAAVIRNTAVDRIVEATAFWVSMLGGVILTAVAAIAAPLLGWFFKRGDVPALAAALAASFTVAAPSRVSIALLSKEMRFGTLAKINVGSAGFGVAIGVAVAAGGGGPWSLVAQTLSVFACQSVAALFARPVCVGRRHVSRKLLHEFSAFGSRVGGYNLANTASRALDGILGGAWVGATGLGLFGMANRLLVMPIGRVCGAVSNVFLPAIIEVEGAEARARSFAGVVRLTAVVVLPVSIGVAAIAPEIAALLPSRWAGVEFPLRVFALGSIVDPVSWYAVALLLALGRASGLFRLGVVLLPLSWAAVVVGARSGVSAGLALAWVVWNVAQAGGLLLMVSQELPLRGALRAAYLRPLGSACAMGVGVRVVLRLTGTAGNSAGAFVGVATGILIYAGCMAWLMRADAQKLISLLLQVPRRTGGTVDQVRRRRA